MSLIKDGFSSGLNKGNLFIDKVGERFQGIAQDAKNLKHLTKEDVKGNLRRVGKASKKALWLGTVATSATAGVASGFILNQIGYQVRTNLMVISEEVMEGKTVRKFVEAPTNKIGLVIDPTDRNLQLLGIATEALGGLIIIAVIATTLNVELSVKEVEVETVKEFNDEC